MPASRSRRRSRTRTRRRSSASTERLDYVQGEFDDPDLYKRIAEEMGEYEQAVFYLEIPPSLFAMVVKNLADAGLTEKARVVLEKPFGHDRESARALNDELREVLDE